MKQWALICVCGLMAAGSAVAHHTYDVRHIMAQGLIMEYAHELGLSDAEYTQLLTAYRTFHVAMHEMQASRAAAAAAIEEAAASGGDDMDIRQQLLMLVETDEKMTDAFADMFSEATEGLSAIQEAHLYVHLSNLDATVDAMLGTGESAVPSHAGGAAAPAPAPAAEMEMTGVPVASDSPEDQILAVLTTWVKAVEAQDLDAMMEPISESFEHYEYGDKAGLRDFLDQAMQMGYMDGVEVDVSEAEVELEGDEGYIYPVDLDGAFGSVTLEFIISVVDGNWEMTGLDISGI